ncbi:thioredoxin domain-containing protein [Oleiharenicola sp. Vm1]|uniref:thioredoxin domain-containing protein n=1 Tax=Oleiharenicola sp. Vm1 TaxID=3398393 RepID=UPI0039F613D4
MPNRLATEKSPYLRQHADNPVDWFPWGDAAFARARAEQKPVFLSIGYSTCHWCHVMAHESFESAAVAEVLNRDFVAIKVDREERPDLDRLYMTYVQQTTGHGGWPMSVWLTPEGKPFHGGTYFPPEDRHGRPGFVTLLHAIAQHWRSERARIEAGAEEIVQALRRYASEGPAREVGAGAADAPLHEAAGAAFDRCFQYFYEGHDPIWGGFGGAPKFPRAVTLNFLLRVAALQGVKSEAGAEAVKMAAFTLQRMAEGGLHDHVGGGFHRYAVDEKWHVPHFEKMLYDQAQIALNCLEARQATGVEVYAWVARGIFDYVQRDLTSPRGGFYSAEDADSLRAAGRPEHAEGAFYVWTKDEIDAALGADAGFFGAHFGVKAGGNVDPAHDPHGEFAGQNVLMQQRPLAQTAADLNLDVTVAADQLVRCLEALRTRRAQRPRPHLDDKVLAAWNGLMISALAKGAQVLGERACLERAGRAAEFLHAELWDEASGTLYRTWRETRGDIPAFAEDYAFLIQGLLDLYEAGFDLRWLQWAERLQARMDALFWDAERGGYFNSRADDPSVLVRLKEDYDGAEPAPSSVAAMNLVRLDWMLGLPGARARAQATIEAFRAHWTGHPHALPQMLGALELFLEPPRTIVLAGGREAAELRALAAVAHEQLGPRRALLHADGGAAQAWLAARRPYLAEMRPVGGAATAFVCEEFACRTPVATPAELRAQLFGGA